MGIIHFVVWSKRPFCSSSFVLCMTLPSKFVASQNEIKRHEIIIAVQYVTHQSLTRGLSTRADIDDLLDVLEELTSIEKKADKLGIALGLSPGRFDPTMESVVQTWLNQEYTTQRHQLPSYRRLVRAVASKVGGSNPALAKRIAAYHPR